MKQIIPFEKEIPFKTMIGEITSISLEHTLEMQSDKTIRGDFVVGGSYKMTEASQLEEDFTYRIPCEISINDDYDIKKVTVSIDDFYYEIINEDTLKVNIDVLIEGLEYDLIKEEPEHLDLLENDREEDEDEEQELLGNVMPIPIEIKDNKVPLNIPNVPSNNNKEEEIKNISSLFNAFKDADETFSTYYVYIVRNGDTLDSILDKYKITKEDLALYNNIENIEPSVKLIIPSSQV
ncbi:MAG: LysM peptidoglycan-binding domain-containing protein [Bacilli bacterium]